MNDTIENHGIDIVGFPLGKLGIGEQTRSLVRAAIECGYQVNLIDVFHSSDRIKNDDQEFIDHIGVDFKYPVRVYTLTQNHIAALIYRYGVEFFDNKKNIFQLAWEFEQRPIKLDAALRFADEIWGISTFTSKAFVNNYGIPVSTMPISVQLPIFPLLTREHFGLPVDKYLFCCSFDFNSSLYRKNPYACVESFVKAFSHENDVGLVIKVSNADVASQVWRDFLNLINNVKNIYLINQVLEKNEVFSLFNVCDAYISLHRSEGFGLGLAENMLLAKPIICTAYSGNMDFCSAEVASLVDFKLVEVNAGDYPYAQGFTWAEPLIESAVEKMRDVYANRDLAAQKGVRGRKMIEAEFSTKAVARKFNTLMQDLLARH